MAWHRGRLAAFDIETTGTDPESDRIVTAAVSLVGGGAPEVHLSWLVDPGIEIPDGAAAVHGVSTERARAEGGDAGEAVREITRLLADQVLAGVPIVAFNARFDLTILDREARRHGLVALVDLLGGPEEMLVVDPHVLDKHFDRYRKGKRTLDAVCSNYRVPLHQAHDANADALAAARLAFRLAAEIPELAALQLRELHASQVTWAAEQAASLEEYFRSRGREERVQRQWPLIAVRETLASG